MLALRLVMCARVEWLPLGPLTTAVPGLHFSARRRGRRWGMAPPCELLPPCAKPPTAKGGKGSPGDKKKSRRHVLAGARRRGRGVQLALARARPAAAGGPHRECLSRWPTPRPTSAQRPRLKSGRSRSSSRTSRRHAGAQRRTPCRDSLGGMHCAAWRGGDRAATDQLRPHRASLAGTARR